MQSNPLGRRLKLRLYVDVDSDWLVVTHMLNNPTDMSCADNIELAQTLGRMRIDDQCPFVAYDTGWIEIESLARLRRGSRMTCISVAGGALFGYCSASYCSFESNRIIVRCIAKGKWHFDKLEDRLSRDHG